MNDHDNDDEFTDVADVVDYCRLVARRVEPEDLASDTAGDGELIDALLRAASAIAV